jgi:hypothetical protein
MPYDDLGLFDVNANPATPTSGDFMSFEEWRDVAKSDPVFKMYRTEEQQRAAYAATLQQDMEKGAAQTSREEALTAPAPSNPFTSQKGFFGPGVLANILGPAFGTSPQSFYNATTPILETTAGALTGGTAGNILKALGGPAILPAAGRVAGTVGMAEPQDRGSALGWALGAEGLGAAAPHIPYLQRVLGGGAKMPAAMQTLESQITKEAPESLVKTYAGQFGQPAPTLYGPTGLAISSNLAPTAQNTVASTGGEVTKDLLKTSIPTAGAYTQAGRDITPTLQSVLDSLSAYPALRGAILHTLNQIHIPSWLGGRPAPTYNSGSSGGY